MTLIQIQLIVIGFQLMLISVQLRYIHGTLSRSAAAAQPGDKAAEGKR